MTTATTTLAERLEESSVTVLLACSVLRRTSVNFIPRYVSPIWADTDTRLSYLDGGAISHSIRITG